MKSIMIENKYLSSRQIKLICESAKTKTWTFWLLTFWQRPFFLLLCSIKIVLKILRLLSRSAIIWLRRWCLCICKFFFLWVVEAQNCKENIHSFVSHCRVELFLLKNFSTKIPSKGDCNNVIKSDIAWVNWSFLMNIAKLPGWNIAKL